MERTAINKDKEEAKGDEKDFFAQSFPLQVVPDENTHRRVAVIDDDDAVHLYLGDILEKMEFTISDFRSAEEFMRYVSDKDNAKIAALGFFDVILCDVRLPGQDGLSFVKTLQERLPEIPIVLMTAYAEVEKAVQAIKEGAYDYLEKPFNLSRLSRVIENAMRLRRLNLENRYLRTQMISEIKLVGIACQSPAMKAIYDLVKRVAPTESSVLITGESGVGKEVIARALHDNSSRSNSPFISINCSAIPESLLESELFGHTKGSFTGATQHRKGLFEEADGGTLFLDEIGDLDFALQAKILRVLQEQKIRPVGDNKFRSVDVRIITATHKNLSNEIKNGAFREDLYYRLNVIPIHIPPLRQRKEDIVALARHFLDVYAKKHSMNVRGFTPEALNKIVDLPWKGNVRELQNVVERSVVLATAEYIDETDLPIGDGDADFEDLMDEFPEETVPSLREIERKYIEAVLKKHNGRKEEAAKVLGMSRRTLYRKLSQREESPDPTLQ